MSTEEKTIDEYIRKAAIQSGGYVSFTSEFITVQQQFSNYQITDKKALDKFAELKLILRAVHENTGKILESLNVKK